MGYGLEPILPDGNVGAILDQYVFPSFKAHAWDQGVLQGVKAVAGLIRRKPVPLLSPAQRSYDRAHGSLVRCRSG